MIKEFKEEYRWLSNFYPVNIEYGNLIFPSVEHFYVAMKSQDDLFRLSIASLSGYEANIAKKLGKTITLRADWDDIKLEVMEYALRQKFNVEKFKTLLLETKDEIIQEGNMWNDKFWGVCLKTNEGENNLGKLIMKIREELIKK